MNPALQELGESESMKVAGLARQLRLQGRDIVSLALGDSHFSPHPHIVEQINAAMQAGKTHYGDPQGLLALREQIAARLPGKHWTPEHLLVVPGLKQGLYYLFDAILSRKICVLEPAWLGYQATAKLVGAETIAIDRTDPDWLDQLTRADFDTLVLCTPNNPDGKIFGGDEIRQLVDICREQNAWLISDEIYSIFDYTNQWKSLADLTDYDQLIICNGFSKSHAMTGFRIGWLASQNRELIATCLKLQQHIATCVNIPTQHGLAHVLAAEIECTADPNYYFENRNLVVETLPNLKPYRPSGGFYFFFPTTVFSDLTGYEFASQLLQQQGVAVVPGGAYGDNFENWIRLSFSVNRSDLHEGLRRIEDFAKGSA